MKYLYCDKIFEVYQPSVSKILQTQNIKFGVCNTLIMLFPINAEPQKEHSRFKRQRGGGGAGLNFKAPVDDMLVAEKLESHNRLNEDETLKALFRRRLRCKRQIGGRPGCGAGLNSN